LYINEDAINDEEESCVCYHFNSAHQLLHSNWRTVEGYKRSRML